MKGHRMAGSYTDERLRGDDGMTAVWIAFLLVIILMFAALAIDGGQAYQSHRQSQNASDVGAMAGVRVVEQLDFWNPCSTSPSPCTNFTDTSSIRTEIMRQAQNTGADAAAGGVQCYLLNYSQQRISTEFCDSNTALAMSLVRQASGVEVDAKETKNTFFAGVAGFKQTAATTTASALVSNFVGGTGSPFIVCGDRDTMPAGTSNPLSWSYDLIHSNGAGGYNLTSGAVGSYYQVQGSQNPSCGASSSTFKGKGSGETIDSLPYLSGITTGNGFQNNIQLAVAGIVPCQAGATTFDGCGMLIPIADYGTGSGTGTQMDIVTWLAFQVWGSGNSYNWNQNGWKNNDPLGTSCGNPIILGNAMKYCGLLLGSVSITGGAGSGPGTAGQPHVLRLST
jgi:hypothetical protein